MDISAKHKLGTALTSQSSLDRLDATSSTCAIDPRHEGLESEEQLLKKLKGTFAPKIVENVSYQIRPNLGERFKPLVVQEIIHNVLYEELSDKSYTLEGSQVWSTSIAELIRDKVRELSFDRYKVIVQVIIGEQRGAGCVVASRCLWDAESDSCASNQFINDTIFSMAVVFAVYYY